MTASNWFYVRRKQLGVTRTEAARQIGVSIMSVWNWEHDRAIPNLRRLKSLSEFYGVTESAIADAIRTQVHQIHSSQHSKKESA